jgi:hypothetical protein
MPWCLVQTALEWLHPNEFQSDIRSGYIKAKFLMLPLGGLHGSMQCDVEFGHQLSICSGTKENLDRVGRSQDLPDVNWLLVRSSILNMQALTLVHICVAFFIFSLKTFTSCFYKHFYLYIFWISTKPCITHVEVMNAYLHKCYTYIYMCHSLFICNFGNLLYEYFGEIGYYKSFVAHPLTKIMFQSSILLFFLQSRLQSYISTHHLICHFHNKYTIYFRSVDIITPEQLFLSPHTHFLYFLSCFRWKSSLTRGLVCNLQCNHSMVWVAQNP